MVQDEGILVGSYADPYSDFCSYSYCRHYRHPQGFWLLYLNAGRYINLAGVVAEYVNFQLIQHVLVVVFNVTNLFAELRRIANMIIVLNFFVQVRVL